MRSRSEIPVTIARHSPHRHALRIPSKRVPFAKVGTAAHSWGMTDHGHLTARELRRQR